MKISMTQISSMQKIRSCDTLPFEEIREAHVLPGERLTYQLVLQTDGRENVTLRVDSPLKEAVNLYLVKDVYMDQPAILGDMEGEDFLTLTPGMMPDVLIPLEKQHFQVNVSRQLTVIWVRVKVPAAPCAAFPITITAVPEEGQAALNPTKERPTPVSCTMDVTVASTPLPAQSLLYTRWFYVDCIANAHHVGIYSEAHWELIDQYLAAAADAGISMILVPIHTPPLDTQIGTTRPCVQLVDITKEGNTYHFGFSRFHRFIELCKKNGIRYYEMAHMFSQWGAKCAANILVTHDQITDYLFGWDTPADAPEYLDFLKQYIAAIAKELEAEDISQFTYFHISDEPSLEAVDAYRRASDIIRPLIGNSKTMDALSSYDFYEKGLVECPVTCVDHMKDFLGHQIPNQWVYYCCQPEKVYTNSFLAMPSRRVRILGFLLYKYDIKGFLHWGFNFYNTSLSRYPVDPYLTTSADGAFASGDAYIVYPGQGCVYPSIRGEITYQAIQDMRLCQALEERIGRDAVVSLIDKTAGRPLTFEEYPKTDSFFETLHDTMVRML